MSHIASQILAEVVARLGNCAPVRLSPLHLLQLADLPVIIIEDILDETLAMQEEFEGAIEEVHQLGFTVFGVQADATPAAFLGECGHLRTAIEATLLKTDAGRRLGGLCRPGLTRPSAALRLDDESLQRPVGGWSLRFVCRYSLNTGTLTVS